MHKRLIEDNLNMLRERLLIMGGAAEKAIMLALRALSERDSELAERVMAAFTKLSGLLRRRGGTECQHRRRARVLRHDL